MKKRIISIMLTVVMIIVSAANGFYVNTTDVTAAESPTTIKMPVVVYDHLDDHLLFEYSMATIANELCLEGLEELTGQDAGKGLVETTLGPNNTPVYKKEIVEHVAKIVETYMEEDHNVDNDLYNELFGRIVTPGSETVIIDKSLYDADLEMLGWDFQGLTYTEIDGDDSWIDANGNVVWYRDGDQLHTNGGVNNKAVFDFGELEAGTYEISMYSFDNINIEVTGNGFSTVINDDNKTFTVPATGNVKLTIYAKDDNEGSLVAPNLVKDDEKILKNFTKNQYIDMSKLGWVYPENSTWGTDVYGGLTCENGETSVAYRIADVIAGKTYELVVDHNENDLCDVIVTDLNGNKIANADEEFVVPEGINQIKIQVSCVDNPNDDYRRLDDMTLEMLPNAALGDYNTSKEKYDNGAKFDDIVTCMDYAYYRLNTFWTDTYGDVTQKTDLYKTITLKKTKDKYKFSSSNAPIYDLENGDIIHGDEDGDGFYPLDSSVLGDKSDLVAPFGNEEILNPYDDLEHNYHFSLKVNCEFLYEESKDLEFSFRGDDDVYVYIDKKLVMDIGGAHLNKEGSIKLNDLAEELGLVDGEVYAFDFFYIERHTTASNMKIETNMIFTPAEAKPDIVIKDKDGNVLDNPATLEAGEEIGIDYKIVAESDKMSNITFEDTNLGVVVGKDGVDLGDEDVYVKDEITVNVYDPEGKLKETISISKEDLDDPDKVEEFSQKVGEIEINTGETVEVTGLYKEVEPDELIKPSLNVDITAPQAKYTEDGTFVYDDEVVAMLPVEKVIVPTTTPEASVDVVLVDSNNNEITAEVEENSYVGVNYTVTAKEDKMKNIGITDNGTGFVMNKEGITIPNGYNVDNGLTVTLKKVDGTTETVTLTKDDIDNKTEKYSQLLANLEENWVLDEGDSVVVTGLNTTITEGTITSDTVATIEGPSPEYNSETGELTVNYVEVAPTDKEEVSTKEASNVFFQVNPEMGSLEGETTDRVYNGETTGKQPTVVPEEGYEFVKWTQTVGGITTDVVGDPKDVVINGDTVFTAVLQPKTYDYVVKYVDKETGKEIADSKTGSAVFGTEVTEEAIQIDHYGVSGESTKSITMKVEGNEIIFEYEIGKVGVNFETDGNGTLIGETSQTVNYGGNASEVTPEANEGYSFDGWTMTNSEGTVEVVDPTAETITEDTVFTANFKVNAYDYVVKYVDKATGKEIATSKSGNANYGTEITENAIDIEGYELTNEATQSMTVKTTGNEIVFEYEIIKLDVDFTTNGNGSLEGETDQTVDYGSTPESVEPKADEGYSFDGWEMTTEDGTVKVEDPSKVEIKEDTTFEAIFTPNEYDYVVKYIDKDTGKEIATSKTGSALFGTEVTEKAIQIDHYGVSGDSTKSITMKVEGNEIVFEYEIGKVGVTFDTDGNGTLIGETSQTVNYGGNASEVTPEAKEGYSFDGWTMTNSEGTVEVADPTSETITEDTVFTANFKANTYDYVVKYIDKETGKEIATSKNGNANYGTEITENAIDIEGYELTNEATQSMTVKTTGNEIVFEYEIIKLDVDFTTNGNGTLIGETEQTVDYGDKSESVIPSANPGYSFDGWEMTTEDGTVSVEYPENVEITKDTTFTAVFTPNTYDYVVKYIDKDTGKEIADSKTGSALFGTEVTEKAITVEHYGVSGESTKSITMKVEGNEIIFEYEIGKVGVNFETDGNGTLIGETSQTVNYGGNASEVTPEANEGYSFDGWTMTNSEGTVKVEDPTAETITEDTVFTANFKVNAYDYVVKYVDKATGKEIATSKNGNANYGTEITENAIDIEGYELTNEATQSMTVKTTGNEIVFEYEIIKLDVDFTTNGNGTLEGETDQTVDYGGNASEVTPEANEGYSFDGWTMTNSEGTVEVADPTAETITEDTVFTANFKANTYDYVVKYIDKDTGKEIAASKTGSALFGTEVTEKAIQIDHYGVSNDATQTIVMKVEGNEIVFEYEIGKVGVTFDTDGNGTLIGETSQTVNYGDNPEVVVPSANPGYSFDGWTMTNSEGTVEVADPTAETITEDTVFTANFKANAYDYVVKYVDKATGKELVESKTGSALFGTEVSENAVAIEGYTLIGDENVTITMKIEGNEIVFEYEIIKLDVDFTTNGNGSLEGETEQIVDYGDKPESVEPKADEGYSFDGWEMTTEDGTVKVEDPSKVEIKEDTTFEAIFTPNTYDYVVKYIDKDTGKEIADSKTGSALFGTEVTEKAIQIDHYGVSGDSTKSITMKVEGNEIIFEYEIGKVGVNFETDGNGTLIGETSQTVNYGGNASEVTPKANEGYSFDGWTMTNSEGTVEVADPTAETITEDTVFTANFTANTYDYVVKYVDKATGKELVESKTGSALFGTEVSENAVAIEGYSLIGDENVTITMKIEGNEIVFEYEIIKLDVDFTTNGNGSLEGETDQTVDYGDKPESVEPKADEGYSFDGWEMTTEDGTVKVEDPSKVEIKEDTTFEAIFTPNTYDYVVKYVDKATREELIPLKTSQAVFGTEVTEEAVVVEGYTLDGDATQTTTIKVEGNEIVFEYNINKFNVNFVADENGTLEGNTQQVVDYKKTAEEVTPVPAKGYEFLGWEMTNSQGTSLCEDPTAVEIIEDTTFTAKFGPLDYGYVVKFVDEDGNDLATEIRGPETTFGTEVSAEAIEITGYECGETSKTITIDVENNEIVFVYKKKVYEVKFETDGNGVIVGNDTVSVKYAEKVDKVPTHKANEGYEFVGWTMTTSTGTTTVKDPAQVEITENVIFTAHYEKNQESGVIDKPDKDKVQSNEDPGDKDNDEDKNNSNKDNDKNDVEIDKDKNNSGINDDNIDNETGTDKNNNDDNDNDKNNDNNLTSKEDNSETANEDNSNNITSEDNTDGNNSGNVLAPKTGYDNILAMLFTLLMAAFATFITAFRRVSKN